MCPSVYLIAGPSFFLLLLSMLGSLPSPSSPLSVTPMPGQGRGGGRHQLRLSGKKGDTLDISNLTPDKKAQLLLFLQTDGDNGDTRFDVVRGHSRKRTVKDTSLTASPASPSQSSAAKRIVKKSKKADSDPLPSSKDVSSVLITEKSTTVTNTVPSDSDSDSPPTPSHGKKTVIPSVSVTQPTTVGAGSQAARVHTSYTRMAPTE